MQVVRISCITLGKFDCEVLYVIIFVITILYSIGSRELLWLEISYRGLPCGKVSK